MQYSNKCWGMIYTIYISYSNSYLLQEILIHYTNLFLLSLHKALEKHILCDDEIEELELRFTTIRLSHLFLYTKMKIST